MLTVTDKRFEQWPHLTVTVLNKLLGGTLTCQYHTLIENPRARDLILYEIYIRIIQIYSKDSVAEAAMDVTELLGR